MLMILKDGEEKNDGGENYDINYYFIIVNKLK
jgi:hypothetical protein